MNFSDSLIKWYELNKRDLPWRQTKDPYSIWLSEVILQQTRVDQGLGYYERMLNAFPTVFDLANATEDRVLRLWQGLGYYSRARNLQRCAKAIVASYNGQFPRDYHSLIELPGIGPYTAAAISSMAFQKKVAAVDGNVIRVVARLFAIDEPVNTTSAHKKISGLAQDLMPSKNPGQHNQGMMELGATICVPINPKCTECPVHSFCRVRDLELKYTIPWKVKKENRKSRYLHFFIAYHKNQVLIEKRGEEDIWAGLYQFPMVETAKQGVMDTSSIRSYLGDSNIQVVGIVQHPKHVLSHQDLFATFYHIELNKTQPDWPSYSIRDLDQLPFPRLITRYLEDRDFKSGLSLKILQAKKML